jgi:hypothetical protein
MRKLSAIYRNAKEEARIFFTPNSFICEVKNMATKEITGKLVVDSNSNVSDAEDLLPIDFGNYYKVPFERKNGKIVLFPINKQKRVIWSNNDYDEWAEAMADEITDEEITPEYYYDSRSIDLDEERANLNIEVDGYIVAFANLDLWNGRRNGAKLVGTNVRRILHSNDDYVTWYCDPYNVKAEMIHHDGTNYVLYRVANDKEQAEKLVNKIAYGNMSEEEFRKRTKSLRPYVAKVYGW